MNTDDTETSVDMEDLGKFEEVFFKTDDKVKEPIIKEKVEPKPEVPTESEDDSLAPEEDTDAEAVAEDDEPEEEEAPVEEQPAKKGKKSFQERINELTAKAREAERREQEALRTIQDYQARSTTEVKQDAQPAPIRESLPSDAPQPDAVNDKDEPVYPLGEFDPQYIRDLTRYSVQAETTAQRQKAQEEDQAKTVAAAQQELASKWATKVQEAETELPDIRSDISTVATQFQNIEPAYGEYLASTIMGSDVGPEIMNYLAQNIGEAQTIVASGPMAATLAIGRLEARLAKSPSAETHSNDKLVSNAPAPPTTSSKGRGARTVVRGDTDDLDAFEKVFFQE